MEISKQFKDDYEYEREEIKPQYYLMACEMNVFEIMRNYKDSYPCL